MSFEVSIPPEQYERIKKRYEFLRKAETYRGPKIKKTFHPRALYDDLEQKAREKITVEQCGDRTEEPSGVKWQHFGGPTSCLMRC